MYHSLEEFDRDFQHHTEETLKVFRCLNDAALSCKVDPQGRDLGFIAWHIVQTYPEMLGQAGVQGLNGAAPGAPAPKSAAALAQADLSPLVGPQAIHASYAAKDPERLTQHIVCNHVVTADSATSARSRCTVILWASRRSEELTPRGRKADPVQQVGEIEDEFVKTDAGWKIRRRRAWFTMYAA